MNYSDFLNIYFSNFNFFIICGIVCIILCYYSVKNIAIAGILDPIHFYWTYTFGTTYSIIIGLYLLGYIDNYMLLIVAISALFLLISIFIGFKFKINLIKYPLKLIYSSNQSHIIFKFSIFIIILFYIIIISNVGLGIFSDVNRFEQNKGVGPFVRVVDALRLFVFTYGFLYIQNYRNKKEKFFLLPILFLGVLISSLSNGAKFSLLEVLYAICLGYVIYTGRKISLSFSTIIKILLTFVIVFSFAILAISSSLEKNGIKSTSQYLSPETPVAIEKIFLRTLSNGDQSYLGLPYNVIDKIPEGNIAKNISSALLGKSLYNNIFGHEDNLYNVGQKILRYHFPSFDQAGGPVSHFDLYFYHNMPIGLNFIFIIFIGLLLSSIINNTKASNNNLFSSSIVSTLWMKGLVLLLEPAMGLVYIIDFLFVMFLIKTLVLILPKKVKIQNGY